ncbi:hypothetical protein K9N68_36185 (plasmid) [Kovacikia minuta CCNUW1]|uniref:hypothetical protein n=1 Tax=Kovacikia minuta TaxID=2931930 RepID=UPI001CCD4F36|nr:hypothetical protein [Kovacikia minuta]UBF30615.1 hypothetical protein K9N68_36185 [Kovacikia minuta CCNUW1]
MEYDSGRENATRETQTILTRQPLTDVRMLLIEDEIDIADLVLFILKEAGADVVWTMRAVQALERFNSMLFFRFRSESDRN